MAPRLRGISSPQWSWFNPFGGSFSAFVAGLTLMLFIYWGWDTSVSVNEETANKHVTPGRAAVFATVILLVIYEVVVLAAQSYAGLGTKGIGLGQPRPPGRRPIGPRRLDFRLVGFRQRTDPPACC